MKNEDDLLWKDGIYNFKSERLESILKKLELYYDVKIVVKSPEILSYRYTGKFRQRMESWRFCVSFRKYIISK